MYLLYADESGSAHDPNGDFFVLAGFSIFERQTHWVDEKVEQIARRFEPYFGARQCELHGSPMFAGNDGWRDAATVPQRVQAVSDALHLLNNRDIKVFASVIEKRLIPDRSQIIPTAFHDIAFAFDRYLRNLYHRNPDNKQRGIILFDKTASERMIQDLSYAAKHIGCNHDYLRNFAEVPVFVDSKASRLIQLADLLAYWLYRYYSANDKRGFNLIQPHILREGGLVEHLSDNTRIRLENANDLGYPFPQPQPN